jgi:two-component system response regulator
MNAAAIHILLVEDNEGDVELAKIAFRQGGVPAHLSVVRDGMEALEYLSKQNGFRDAPRPDLVLLDLNMPRMGGKEFLATVKTDRKLKSLPVIVFTSSSAPKDIAECYERHANCYILKPPDLAAFTRAAQQVGEFWLNLAQLPPA